MANLLKITIANDQGEVFEILTENEEGDMIDSTGEPFCQAKLVASNLEELIDDARNRWRP